MFVVQENHGPHKYTRIHEVRCSHARPSGHTTRNTKWYPREPAQSFDTYRQAFEFAQSLGQPDGPFPCSYCRP